MVKTIVIAGETGNYCLETSYYNAAIDLGLEAHLFDTKKAVLAHARLGKVGQEVHRFFSVKSWVRKANKDFITFVVKRNPDLVILFTGAEILPGTIGYLRSILKTRIVWYWADPLQNLSNFILEGARFSNLVASYSKSSLGFFETMGAPRTMWIPFAGDTTAHHKNMNDNRMEYDVSFTGSWRPEREEVLKTIHQAMPHLRLRIDGPYWSRCEYQPIRKLAGKKPLYGPEFSAVVQKSLISLNVTDTTNFPAPNMRFFEILASGGTELVSGSDEMKSIFVDGEDLLYFNNNSELLEQVALLTVQPELSFQIRRQGYAKIAAGHLYTHRLTDLLANV